MSGSQNFYFFQICITGQKEAKVSYRKKQKSCSSRRKKKKH